MDQKHPQKQINVLTCSMWLPSTEGNQWVRSFSTSKKGHITDAICDLTAANYVANLHGQNGALVPIAQGLDSVSPINPPFRFYSRCVCTTHAGLGSLALTFSDLPGV